MSHASENIISKELKELIGGCLINNRSSQRKLYELYGSPMMGICLRYCESRDEAEEVLQDGFLLVFKNINQFQFRGSFEGWMSRIMINCALQRIRSKIKDFKSLPINGQEIFLSTDADLLDRLSQKELVALIQTLPPAYRLVFNLYVFEGLRHSEIAKLLNISEGTSKSNLSDARQILKRRLTRVLKPVF